MQDAKYLAVMPFLIYAGAALLLILYHAFQNAYTLSCFLGAILLCCFVLGRIPTCILVALGIVLSALRLIGTKETRAVRFMLLSCGHAALVAPWIAYPYHSICSL